MTVEKEIKIIKQIHKLDKQMDRLYEFGGCWLLRTKKNYKINCKILKLLEKLGEEIKKND